MTVGGTISKVDNFANTLQVAVDAGAKGSHSASSVSDYQTVPADLIVKPTNILFRPY